MCNSRVIELRYVRSINNIIILKRMCVIITEPLHHLPALNVLGVIITEPLHHLPGLNVLGRSVVMNVQLNLISF